MHDDYVNIQATHKSTDTFISEVNKGITIVAQLLLRTFTSYVRVWIQVLVTLLLTHPPLVQPWGQKVVFQMFGSLPLTWETRTEFQPPDFDLDKYDLWLMECR